jgi:hypothetical protein
MLPLALALTLLTGGTDVSIGMPAGVHLLAEAPPPLLPAEPLLSDAQASASQLQIDIEALRKGRPGLGGAITLISVGGTFAILGAIYAATSAGLGTVLGGINSLLIIGIVGLAIGVPMIVIGVWMIVNRIAERSRTDEEIKRLRVLLDERRKQEREFAPPPGQGFAPQVMAPRPSLVLALF